MDLETLVNYAMPMRVKSGSGAEERAWMLRLAPGSRDAPSVPSDAELTRAAKEAVALAHEERGLVPDTELVGARVHVFGPTHLMVIVRTREMEADHAHSWVVAAVAVILAIERSLTLEDVQGIPRRYWRLFMG